jgi:hypothetical protein
MTWAALIPVIVSNGLAVAEKLWQLFSNNTAPTQADWDALKELGKQNARSQMMLALAQNGIDPASPQGQALLALTPP